MIRKASERLIPYLGWHITFVLMLFIAPVLVGGRWLMKNGIRLISYACWIILPPLLIYLVFHPIAAAIPNRCELETMAKDLVCLSPMGVFGLLYIIFLAIWTLLCIAAITEDFNPTEEYIEAIQKNMPKRRKRKAQDEVTD